MLSALALQTGGALINSLGNKYGTSLFGGTTSQDATKNTLNDVNKALDMAVQRAPELLIGTNAAGQKSDAARAGYQLAENSFAPTAQMVADRARTYQKADSLEGAAENAMRTAQLQQGRQSANLQEQIVDQAGYAGGSPAALAAIAKAGVNANADSALNLAAQTAQQQQQGMAQAEGMRQQGQQSFIQSMQDEYNRRVVPYMNKFENMANLGASLAGQIANSSAQQYGQDVMVNNPLAGLGEGLNAIGGGMMQKAFTDDPYAGKAGFKDDASFDTIARAYDGSWSKQGLGLTGMLLSSAKKENEATGGLSPDSFNYLTKHMGGNIVKTMSPDASIPNYGLGNAFSFTQNVLQDPTAWVYGGYRPTR